MKISSGNPTLEQSFQLRPTASRIRFGSQTTPTPPSPNGDKLSVSPSSDIPPTENPTPATASKKRGLMNWGAGLALAGALIGNGAYTHYTRTQGAAETAQLKAQLEESAQTSTEQLQKDMEAAREAFKAAKDDHASQLRRAQGSIYDLTKDLEATQEALNQAKAELTARTRALEAVDKQLAAKDTEIVKSHTEAQAAATERFTQLEASDASLSAQNEALAASHQQAQKAQAEKNAQLDTQAQSLAAQTKAVDAKLDAAVKVADSRLAAIEGRPTVEQMNQALASQAKSATLKIEPSAPQENRIALGSVTVMSVKGQVFLIGNVHVAKSIMEAQDPTAKVRPFKLTDRNGNSFTTSLQFSDEGMDLAVFKVPDKVKADLEAVARPLAPVGNPDWFKEGSTVFAAGNPKGLFNLLSMGTADMFDASNGQGSDAMIDYPRMIHTDAAVNPGSSGGILMNTRGEVIGINQSIVAADTGAEGLAFAIPADGIFSTLAHEGLIKPQGEAEEALVKEFETLKAQYLEKMKNTMTLLQGIIEDLVPQETLDKIAEKGGGNLDAFSRHLINGHFNADPRHFMNRYGVDVTTLGNLDPAALSPEQKDRLKTMLDDLLSEHGFKERKQPLQPPPPPPQDITPIPEEAPGAEQKPPAAPKPRERSVLVPPRSGVEAAPAQGVGKKKASPVEHPYNQSFPKRIFRLKRRC